MDGKLKIGLVQVRCEKADIKGNLEAMYYHIDEADRRKTDVLAFPEMNLTGYADPTRYPKAIVRPDGPEMSSLLEATRGRCPAVLAGFIEHNPYGLPYISQAVIHDGRLLGIYRKTTVIDQEFIWFTAGEETPIFRHAGVAFGIAICADISDESLFAGYARLGAGIVFRARTLRRAAGP